MIRQIFTRVKKAFIVFFILFSFSTIPSISWALPECPSSGYFHNCFGTYIWDNGDKYVGEWKNDKKHGQGTFTVGNLGAQGINAGDKYVGKWRDDKKYGQGTYTWGEEGPNKGDKYIGEYRDGKMDGQGTYFWADGRKDVGEWENDKLNGYAIQYNADGNIYREGIFKDDVFQYAQKKSSNNSNSNSKLNKYKEFCEEIGFKPGTEKFADCVLEAMKKD